MKGVSFLSRSESKVQLEAAFQVVGQYDAPGDANKMVLDRIRDRQKDGELPYNAGLYVYAATNTAIHIRGPVREGAIDLWQPYDTVSKTCNEQRIRWYRTNPDNLGAPSTLHARPATGDFVFTGGNLNCQGNGTISQKGLSSTSTPAKNLCGINESVPAGATQHTVQFPSAETDSVYGLMVECSWLTRRAITQKTTGGFTITFDQPAPVEGGKLDWLLVR